MPISLTTCDSILPWYVDWRRLWRKQDATPFLHPAWHAAYITSRGNSLHPVILGAWQGDVLVGVLPMRLDRDGVLRFLSASQSDYEDALFDSRCADTVLSAFANFLVQRRFDLAEVPEDSQLGYVLEAKSLKPIPAAPCPGVVLSVANLTDVTGRKSLRRHEKRLSLRGPLSLESVISSNRVPALQKLFDQHIARRIDVGDDSMFLNPLNRAFYEALTAHPDFPEFGDFQVLKAGEHEAAFHVALRNRQTYIWYKPTFDLNLESEGPGEVLLKSLFEYAYATGAAYFDFSRGDEPFKLRFSNHIRSNRRFTHRVPLATIVHSKLSRRWLQLKGNLTADGHKLRDIASRARVIQLGHVKANSTDAPMPRLDGHELVCGTVDLVEFGALRMHCPEYVTKDRMQAARERRKRGDRLLVVRRRSDNLPVHCAWVRRSERVLEIFDSWTRRGRSARQIRRWAAHWIKEHAELVETEIKVKY